MARRVAGSRLGGDHLRPCRVEVLLGGGLTNLLHQDERGHQDEGPQHRPNSERVPLQESKR